MIDVMKIARESRLDVYALGRDNVPFKDTLERFAALHRAAVLKELMEGVGEQAQPVAEIVTEEMKMAVRWAPSSAYWSQVLVEIFGSDARMGIDSLEKQLREALTTQPQRKPLTDKEIEEITKRLDDTVIGWSTHEFARAVEAAHGIKE